PHRARPLDQRGAGRVTRHAGPQRVRVGDRRAQHRYQPTALLSRPTGRCPGRTTARRGRMDDMTAQDDLVLRLDGEVVRFHAGETLYEVAARHGKVIPTLCYDPRLAPFGACRLCAVEVRGARAPVAACTTQAVVDMVVNTQGEALDRYRRTLLEMVASENPRLAVSPLRGYSSQELSTWVEAYQADTGRFAGAHSGHSRADDPNPFILRDYDLCISCYRCVRVCAE